MTAAASGASGTDRDAPVPADRDAPVPAGAVPAIDPDPHARVEWILEEPLVPGQTARTAVLFHIDDGWHTYGNVRNDTGFPARFEGRFPEGVEIVREIWPAPERHVSPGDILDHVYTERVPVFLDLRLAPSVSPGRLDLGLVVDWLICREACIFEGDSLSVQWEVATPGSAVRIEKSALLAPFYERIPTPIGPNDGITVSAPFGEGEDDVRVRIQAPGAERLVYMPFAESVWLTHPLEDTRTERDRLELRLEPGTGEVRGLLEVLRNGRVRYFEIS